MATADRHSQRIPESGSRSPETETRNSAHCTIHVRGIRISDGKEEGILLANRELAQISVREGAPLVPKNVSITRDFFDEDSEATFLKLCTHGYDSVRRQTAHIPSEGDWRTANYTSKISVTWYPCKGYEVSKQTSSIKVTNAARERLRKIEGKLQAGNTELKSDDINNDITAFFRDFGSHVSDGPFIMGGYCVKKVSVSDVEDALKEQAWKVLNDEFNHLNPENVDISSVGGESHSVSFQTSPKEDIFVEFRREVQLFGGENRGENFQLWRESLSKSRLIVSGTYQSENLLPVWKLLPREEFSDSTNSLCEVLERSIIGPPRTHSTVIDSEVITEVDNDDKTNKAACENLNATRDQEQANTDKLPELLRMLNLNGKLRTLKDVIVLGVDDEKSDIMQDFLKCIISLDYRGRKCIQVGNKTTNETHTPNEKNEVDLFDEDIDSLGSTQTQGETTISAMDVTHAILHSCNTFLRQELLWKMAECRLAVPVLLPGLNEGQEVQFLLWGLRKIYKSWVPQGNLYVAPTDKSVVSHPIPIIGFLRFGNISLSKSKLLNKIMGKLQGNNGHSFFVDVEEEPPCAKWSKGTVEAAWFLPETSNNDDKNNALLDAVTFFNLRGDASNFPRQTEFMCRSSDIVVHLIEGTRYKCHLSQIKSKYKSLSKHILCIVCTNDHSQQGDIKQQANVTRMFSSPFLGDIGTDVCRVLKSLLWPSNVTDKPASTLRSIEALVELCTDLKFEIDENKDDCISAKVLASAIMTNVRSSPGKYKETHLPLQGTLWKKWAKKDKQWNKGHKSRTQSRSIMHYQDELREEMKAIHEEQLQTVPTADILNFISALKQPPNIRYYFMEWLSIFLNDLSQDSIAPLRRDLRCIQSKIRDIKSERSNFNAQPEKSEDVEAKLHSFKKEESALRKTAKEITLKIDNGSLGIEHYIREIGQRFEAYEALKGDIGTNVDTKINFEELPDIAANLLVNGYPFEILDGDVGRVPIKWVQAVFRKVTEKIQNARVSAIAVLGIQSSGKSTLLNSMFGLRFAVSAGRCTRGVFIQLLKVHEDVRKMTECEYVFVIDTEGLKAPELSNRDNFRHDNELATFALCLADLTIINIAGQTVGKDMTDVLQIAAHAFIRMKEVNIKTSCRIIQQFVADLTAADKNEEGTEAILLNLDEAVTAAAKDEGYEKLYTGFSDVFNLKRNKAVQYIPSLWQGPMTPPNHRYSEKIMELKTILINDLKQSSMTMDKFTEKTGIVWNAVKTENFIFSFQNVVIALRYKTFQHVYGKWVGEMRQAIMEWESNAKHALKVAQSNDIGAIKRKYMNDIQSVVENEAKSVEDRIIEYLSENIEDDDDQLHKYQEEFLQDLDLTKRRFQQDARESLERVVDSIAQLNHIDILLPRCKNQLRERARKQAIELRKEHTEEATLDKLVSEEEINQKFEELWKTWIKEICDMYPPKEVLLEDVESAFDFYISQQGQKKDISVKLRQRLGLKVRKTIQVVSTNFSSSKCYQDQKQIIDGIIDLCIRPLKSDIANELSFEPVIIQKLVDSAIMALNAKYNGCALTQEVKINTITEICERAIPLVFKGRSDYNNKYSLGEILTREKESLREDFRALCSDAFQDKRASDNVNTLFEEKIVDVVQEFMGPAIYKAVSETCPYFMSKFSMIGHILEDIAAKEDFNSYYKFIFELDGFLESWTLARIAEFCTKPAANKMSIIKLIASDKMDEMLKLLLKSVNATVAFTQRDKNKNSRQRFTEFIEYLQNDLREHLPGVELSDDDVRNLLMFKVEDIDFFGQEVQKSCEWSMSDNVMARLDLPSIGDVNKAAQMLRMLPTKPHEEIKKHVSGCLEQCPICHAPCDNMTKKHEKHRAELHYPEGVVGCATASSGRLICNICTSSVTTDASYWDGQRTRKYANYQKDYPSWVIQPIENDTPLKYWKWVLNRFNEDFAQMYSRKEADLPRGWKEITKKQALDDLREAYLTKNTTSNNTC